jgi:hypothetical protein
VRGASLVVFVLWLGSTVAWGESAEWFLMSRHGECAPLTVLGRKNPEWGKITDPYQFIEIMRNAGHQTDVQEHNTPEGTVVQVDVPAVELSVMFVGRSVCRGFIDHER